MLSTSSENRAADNAAAWADSIETIYEAWQFCQDDAMEDREISPEAKRVLREHDYDGTNKSETLEAIEQEMRESILSLEVRSGWHSPGDYDGPEEFMLLLSTGGPALRLIGDLDQHGEPRRCWLEHQDWFKPWAEYHGGTTEALEWFAGLFWYGEG